MKPISERMIKNFLNKYKKTYSPINKQIKSMQCSVSVDADSLTALIGNMVTFSARVEPPGLYQVLFKIDGTTIDPIPTLS